MELTRTLDSHSDVRALAYFGFDLPEGATLYGDKAYNDYFIEDELEACCRTACGLCAALYPEDGQTPAA